MNRIAIINLGLARCGTTATEELFRRTPGISTPVGIKELKFFLKDTPENTYEENFPEAPEGILFESSPPYSHNGLEVFSKVLENIKRVRNSGFDVYLIFNVRNLISRAFSHYWHDINGQYSIFGRQWRIKALDDSQRYGTLYHRSFFEELSDPGSTEKFMPQIGAMIEAAIGVFGEQRVRIMPSSRLDEAIYGLATELGLNLTPENAKTRRLPGASAPTYLYGGERGTQFTISANGKDLCLDVPAQTCLLSARRHTELLDGSRFDLAKIISASKTWTRSAVRAEYPASLREYAEAQLSAFARIPEICYYGNHRAVVVEEIGALPERVAIKEAVVPVGEFSTLLKGRAVSAAERDGKVMAGRNGRLFLDRDMNEVVKQHKGELLLNSEQLMTWVNLLHARHRYCAERNIKYAMLFAPDPHAVYREDVPHLDGRESSRPVLQILEACDKPYVVYPLGEMRKARMRGEVYHTTDSHWSPFGALVALRTLVEQAGIGLVLPDPESVELVDKYLVGDLGKKLEPALPGRTTEVVLPRLLSKQLWSNGINNRGHMSFWRSARRDLPKILLNSDSYAWKALATLPHFCSDLLFIHSPVLETEAIERFQPDIVISLLAERFAYKVPDDQNGERAIMAAQKKSLGASYPDFSAL